MFAGDVEVDEVLTNNDVGDTITIVSDLEIQMKSQNILEIYRSSLLFPVKNCV